MFAAIHCMLTRTLSGTVFFLPLLRGVPTKLFSRGEHIFNSTRPIRLLTLAPTKTKKFNLKINADQSPVTTSQVRWPAFNYCFGFVRKCWSPPTRPTALQFCLQVMSAQNKLFTAPLISAGNNYRNIGNEFTCKIKSLNVYAPENCN